MKTNNEIKDKLETNLSILIAVKSEMNLQIVKQNVNTDSKILEAYAIICGQLLSTKEMIDYIGE